MHELSICRSIADIVTRHAAGREVATVHVQIGKLRQIVPETLTYCWSLTISETPLAHTTLQVESIPGSLRCTACDTTQILEKPILICSTCGGSKTEIVAGEEFQITTLDLAEA